MASSRKVVVHQYPARSSSESLSSGGYTSDGSTYQSSSSSGYNSSSMSSTSQNSNQLFRYEAPASAPSKEVAYAAYEAQQAANAAYAAQVAAANGAYTTQRLERTTQPTGQRHDVAGGPAYNPHGYWVRDYNTPNRQPLTVHQYGAQRSGSRIP